MLTQEQAALWAEEVTDARTVARMAGSAKAKHPWADAIIAVNAELTALRAQVATLTTELGEANAYCNRLVRSIKVAER